MEAKKIDISDYEKSKAKYQKLLLTESQLNNELQAVLNQSAKLVDQLSNHILCMEISRINIIRT